MSRKAFSGITVLTLLLISTLALAFNIQTVKAWTGTIYIRAGTVNILSVDWWPMFRHDLRHTGYSTSKAPKTNQILWTFTTEGYVDSSPAIANGMVFVGGGRELYCLNMTTGAHIWSYTTEGGVSSSPAVVGGMVFVGSGDHHVYALNATTGTLIWSFPTAGWVGDSPAISNGIVFVGTGCPYAKKGWVYALNVTTGAQLWNKTLGSWLYSSPAVADGMIFIGADGLYALNETTGDIVWSHPTGTSFSSPTVVDGMVFLGAHDGNIYAVNETTGDLIWKYTTGDIVTSSPAVAYGKVFIGSQDSYVYALNKTTGTLIWRYSTAGYPIVMSSPAVADGIVFIGSQKIYWTDPFEPPQYMGCIYALNETTGDLIWKYEPGSGVDSSPAIANGMMFIGSRDSKVYAFGTPTWNGTVYISADGSINPPDAPVITYDNVTYTLTGNITSSGNGIVVERDNIVIDGAGYTIQGTGSGTGIDLSGRTNVTVKNAQIKNFNDGIYLYSSSNNNLMENNITVHGAGVELYWSSNNIVSSNNIIGCWVGVYIDTSQSNIVYSNFIANCWKGIYVYLSPYNNILTNLIMANEYGIDLYSSFYRSDYNNIYSNNILNNTCGIFFSSASDNHIFHNNFINNIDQALVFYVEDYPYPSNVWDDGYPSGGNYWSDYAGVDQFSGPYQNISGADNIGDIPYEIHILDITRKIIGVDRDHYPLMNPWNIKTPIACFTWTPSVPEVGEVVTFNASASIPIGGEIVSYEWDFGDGSHATDKIVTHVYGSAGTFTVTLNVTDSEGLWDVEQKQIEVKAPPQPLTVSISPLSASILLGESVTFTSTASGGCPPYTYQWYLNGNPVSGATSDTWTFTPAAIGVYYVYVRVIDCKNDAAQSEIAYISVTSAPVVAPIAAFTWNPRSPLEGETVVFDASSSRPDSGEIVRFVWSFGDGGFGEGQLVTHTYSRAGLYKVTLTVFSSEGLSDDVSDYIFVRPKCFILTAVLGTDAEGDLNYLRLFRDKILRTNPVGEAFVTFYYEASPPIAEQLSRNQPLRVLTAILFVQPLIVTVKILLSPYSIALYAALAALFLYTAKKRKLKALLTFIQVSAITATAISLAALTLGLIAKTIPQASIIASIMLPTIIPTAIIMATIKTFKKFRR